MSWTTTTSAGGVMVGSISGTTLTVMSGTCQPGFILAGSGVTACTVKKQLTGTQNNVGTYEVTVSQTVAATTITGTIRTITQSGTNADFSGLAGLTGVTVSAGASGRKIYTLDSCKLTTSTGSDVTINPRFEELFFINSPFLEITNVAGATFTINGSFTGAGGLTEYTKLPWATLTRDAAGYNGTGNAGFTNSGTIIWRGGTLIGDPCYIWNAVGSVTVNNAYATATGTSNSIFAYAPPITEGPFFVNGKRYTVMTNNSVISGFAPQNGNTGVDNQTPGGNTYSEWPDLQPYNNLIDIYLRSNGGHVITGCSRGMSMVMQNPATGSTWQGLGLLQRNVNHTVSDPSGTPIVGAKIYSTPTNDGNRVDLSAFGPARAIFNFTNAPAQSWITTAGGVTTTQAVKLKGWWQVTAPTIINSATITRYTRGGDDLAVYLFYGYAYGYLPATNTVGLNGILTFTNAFVLPVDPSIVSSAAAVAAITIISTAAQLYDIQALYLLNNFVGQGFYCTRAGDVINAGAYNVILDPSAAAVFSVVGNTITIKASTFTGSLTTTGTITLLNGATISGIATDAAGSRATLVVSAQVSLIGAEIRVYDLDDATPGSLGTELAGVESCTTDTFSYLGTLGNTIWVQVMLPGYLESGTQLTLSAAPLTLALSADLSA